MNIGVLTFYRVANFGANLQAVSTYYYLLNNGHNPLFILYESEETVKRFQRVQANEVQKQEHIHFIDTIIPRQSFCCSNAEDINRAIIEYNLDALIIGSDAVLQHHPLCSRIKKGKRKPFYIQKMVPERLFPNCFWGCGLSDNIPIAMMSVSSQNSEYRFFSHKLRQKMAKTLTRMKYISVRDTWTQNMVSSITDNQIIPSVTPDPVFAFNLNAGNLVPDENSLRTVTYSIYKNIYTFFTTFRRLYFFKSILCKHTFKHCVLFFWRSATSHSVDKGYRRKSHT